MKNLNIFLVIIFILSIQISFSQNRNEQFTNGVYNNNIQTFALQKINKIYNSEYSKHIVGTIYLFEDWKNCNITFIKDKSLKTKCNYNLFDDRLEFNFDNELYFMDNSNVKNIKISNEQYFPMKNIALLSNPKLSNYYKSLAKGKNFELIQTYTITIQQVSSKHNLGTYENKIKIKKHLFFKQNDKYIPVPKKKKNLYKVLNLDEESRQDLKNLNLKKEKDLIELTKSL